MLERIEDPNEYSLHTGLGNLVFKGEFVYYFALDSFYCISVALKEASNTIRIVNESFSMERFCHLKRIRKTIGAGKYFILNGSFNTSDHVKVLLERIKDDSQSDILKQKLEELSLPVDNLEVVQVPTRHPITKAQYEKWNAIWPLNFHESTYERLKSTENDHFNRLFKHWESYIRDNDLGLLIVENHIPDERNESLAIFESASKELDCPNEGTKYPFDHLVLRVINESPKNVRVERNGKIPYLLSGCVAFLLNEPCTMCSMCLLHSRIDCVIYLNAQKCGALGYACLLHCNEGLNHHFPVYKRT